jgi:hypothetical protein
MAPGIAETVHHWLVQGPDIAVFIWIVTSIVGWFLPVL